MQVSNPALTIIKSSVEEGDMGDMKNIWADMFFDMDDNGLTREDAAKYIGKEIRDDVDNIEGAIKDFDLQKALSLIWEMKKNY